MEEEKPTLAIIIPCYNEEEVLPIISQKLSEKITQLVNNALISGKSALVFVDDGSKDNTWNLIEKYHKDNPDIINGIKLSENSGQQNALCCGLLSVMNYSDITISVDADLQDDIDAIDKMLEAYFAGYEIVCGVRSNRDCDSFLKKTSALFYYRLMRFLGSSLIYNHSEFRLMGSKAVNALAEYNAKNMFLRGIITRLGFEIAVVNYNRRKRLVGKTKYSMWKLIKLAFSGIASIGVTRKYAVKAKTGTKKSPGYRIEKILFSGELKNRFSCD